MSSRYQLRRSMLNPASATAIELISLDKELVRFGRNPDQVQIVLHSNLCPNMISREHAHIRQIRNNDGSVSYYLFDTSLNGTYVNDIRVNSSVLLHAGDIVKFGHVNGAAMAPGQPAPQPYAEFAYVFEKMPRAASSQQQTASIAAHQVQAAAYDAAARSLTGSPHSWPGNPYAQLAATPAAAAAYFAATGFSHPYLGAIPPGLLTPPPSAATNALSTSTTAANQPSTNISPFAAGGGAYSNVIGGSNAASAAQHHQQSDPFRPAAVMAAAAAAEAAAWLGVATAAQNTTHSLPAYHHQPTSSTAQFPFGGHLNNVAACLPNASMSSIAQHERQKLQQRCQQQQPLVHNLAAGSWSNKAPGTDAESISMMHKRQDHLQPPTGYAFPVFGQRPQAYLPQATNIISGDPTISSNKAPAVSSFGNDRVNEEYVVQGQAQPGVRTGHGDVFQRLQQGGLSQNALSGTPDCEILPAPPSGQSEIMSTINVIAKKQPVQPEKMAESLIHNSPARHSVVVETQAGIPTYGGSSLVITQAGRMQKSSPDAGAVLSTTTGSSQANEAGQFPAPNIGRADAELRKVECDSSVPSPPEDPVRRKTTGVFGSSGTGEKASEEAPVVEHGSSLNTDLLRLAADARTRCLNATASQEDMFDLETVNGSRENGDGSKSTGAVSTNTYTASTLESKADDHLADCTSTTVTGEKTLSETQKHQRALSPPETHKVAKKQRSTEVKRLYEDLQSSYLFTQRQKKARDVSSESQSSKDSSPSDRKKEKTNSVEQDTESSSSSRSQSVDSEEVEKVPDRRKTRSANQPQSQHRRRRAQSTSSSSDSSTASDDDSEGSEDTDSSVSVPRRGRSRQTGKKPTSGRNKPSGRNGGTKKNVRNTTAHGRSSRRSAPGNKTTPAASVRGGQQRKRRRTTGEGGENVDESSGQKTNRRTRKTKQQSLPLPAVRPEDTWKYHDPSQLCAAGNNCIKPDGDNVDWVECDDCERWFHVNCVGCVFDEVKDEDTAFHCGCVSN